MKRLLFAIACTSLLAACTNSGNGVTYSLKMDVADAGQRQQLVDQSMRVIQRRMDRIGEEITDHSQKLDGSTGTITIDAKNKAALDELTAELTQPFNMKIMAQTQGTEKPDITVEGHGGFKNTGVTGDDLLWVEGGKEPGKNMGQVTLTFTPEGRTKMAAIFKAMKGKYIGLFVRDQLVSKLLVDTDEVKDKIVIQSIPNPELAEIFSDDVNVGIHVTFTPVP